VTPDPAVPLFGERVHLALAGVATAVVVVPDDPAVEWVVVAAVGWVVGPEDTGATGWSVWEVQPVTAEAATKTAVAMMWTGRMVTPPTTTTLVSPGPSLR
jgi:hypothetical protein